MMDNLKDHFGNIDIYLFDQLLKGTYDNCKTVIDVGCGSGRNIFYFLKNGFEVYGIDPQPEAIELVKNLSAKLSPGNNLNNFRIGLAEEIPFEDNFFDLAICNAVLHFAQNQNHFDAMVTSIGKKIKPGGFFFARLASDIGIEERIADLGDGRFYLPDGSERFLVNEEMLMSYTNKLRGKLYEPIKTTNVQNLRCMTTWCLQKI
ncbi:MAG TPA: class I SAM-dependent methyltransferase [Segetibacter sp.]|jgi:SAM-dependent methyltransferase